jgi:hypothetical protein
MRDAWCTRCYGTPPPSLRAPISAAHWHDTCSLASHCVAIWGPEAQTVAVIAFISAPVESHAIHQIFGVWPAHTSVLWDMSMRSEPRRFGETNLLHLQGRIANQLRNHHYVGSKFGFVLIYFLIYSLSLKIVANMFLRNVGWLWPVHMALYPRTQTPHESQTWDPSSHI